MEYEKHFSIKKNVFIYCILYSNDIIAIILRCFHILFHYKRKIKKTLKY